MSTIAFHIEQWHALSPGFETPDAWKNWDNTQSHALGEQSTCATHLIPAMMRRRMSSLSKIALQTALELQQSQNQPFDYLVFSSRHGELPRTVEILQQVLQGEEASPMAFSQSVHNTSAGLFTIANKSPIPATSLAGCESSLHHALIEAYAYLNDNPDHRVLVIDFDAPLPEPYDIYEASPTPPLYALGLVLRAGNTTHIHWQPQANEVAKLKQAPQTLNIIKQLACEASDWQVDDHRNCWQWQRTVQPAGSNQNVVAQD